MKIKRKEELKRKREREKQKAEEDKKNEESKIIHTINPNNVLKIKELNKQLIQGKSCDEETAIEVLKILFEIIKNSNYLSEITNMTINNISSTWFGEEVNEEFVENILDDELEKAKDSSMESIALKITYWSNRIAHQLQEEFVNKNVKQHHINELYIKYFLNPQYNYDVFANRDLSENKSLHEMLSGILEENNDKIDGIKTPEQLNDLFYGLTIRNELWTLKQEMLQLMLLKNLNNENSPIRISSLPEDERVSITGKNTLRLVIREINGISPIVMHCEEDKLNEFLKEKQLKPIKNEESAKIIEFAKDGKVGIYFVLDDENLEILDYEASCNNGKTKVLNDVLYQGENDDGR